MRCFLEALCPPAGGLALEMGSGTTPLMHACIASDRPYYSFDSDPDFVGRILQPLVDGPSASTRDQSSSDEEISESEPVDNAYGCPFD